MTGRFLQIQIIAAIFVLLAACGQNHGNESKGALLKTTNPAPITIGTSKPSHVEKIKNDVSSFPEVYDVAVMKGKKDTLVVYKVKHMNRFRMKAIEAKINKFLEKRYPKENFKVSSDYKIFLEAVRLKEAMKTKDLSKKEAEKQLQKIIKLKDETT
ncbi:sporulation protein [Bacillus sp. EB600]|uniref:sporulation protein n=1 Tax=Bacillus sp. EB600 TaxID=2806345 RepID=UPI00210AF1F8|nr:sporulation protein [Bacillus sp. EB600]MCQ6280947.1 sporulation protein [Bacillus sp. EB600]